MRSPDFGIVAGLAILVLLCASLPYMSINAGNLTEYLSCDKILCCGGSWMVKGDLVKAGDFGNIRELSAEAGKLVDTIQK